MAQKVRKYMVIELIAETMPQKSMFKIVEDPIPELKRGEALVKTEYISVDPYMWSFAPGRDHLPYLQFGFQVGTVVESKSQDYEMGSYVVSHSGWCDHAVIASRPDDVFRMKPYVPDLGGLQSSLAVGALGMPGVTAYLGLLEVCRPRAGDVVCVTSACGAVGSLVGQIARLKGCTVIGFTGTDEKVNILKDRLKFDHAFNYKTVEKIVEKVKSLVPNGIDCFFDNVGGSLYGEILQCMSGTGRVAICGSISTYGGRKETARAHDAPRGCSVEAFSFTQWSSKEQAAARAQMRDWIEKDQIIAMETVTEGFEKLPDAFIGMLEGKNTGKSVVKVF